MKRNVSQLSQRLYDVAIIGGGVYGASVARDAASRGLTVALFDKGDFGGATSANSHKIIHGGLRYLQHCDLKRMRQSIRERTILMRIAPHLVHPLPFLIPTYKGLLQGRLVMSTALKLNDLISLDRNQHIEAKNKIPPGRVISKDECLSLCPGLDQRNLTGGALFFDAQVYNADRLNLSLLLSAAKDGADLANYCEVVGFLQDGNKITGLEARDVLSGDLVDVQARVVVNCSGPWIDRIFNLLKTGERRKGAKWLKGVVLVTRPVVQKVAVGIPSRTQYNDQDAIVNKGFRYFCITPWRNTSLIGTFQVPYDGEPDDFHVTEQDIHCFISEVNAAFPGAAIKNQDVHFMYGGLLPRSDANDKTNEVQLIKNYRVNDHAVEDGIEGLISVVAVKYTTARDVAEKTVNLVVRKLGRKPVECRTAITPVHGGSIDGFERIAAGALENKPIGVSEGADRHLIHTYGSEYRRILKYCEEDPVWGEAVTNRSPVIRAEVLHGVREEMAQKLSDVIFRRTELGTASYPGDTCLKACAEIMAAELGWDDTSMQKELEETKAVYASLGCIQ